MASNKTQHTMSAREQARQMATGYQDRDKKSSLLLRLGVVGLVLLVVAAMVLMVSMRDDPESYTAGTAPAVSTVYGGVVLASDTEVVEQNELDEIDASDTPSNILSPDSVSTVDEADDRPKVTLYTDPACPYCSQFEQQYHTFFSEKLANEEILLEYRPIAFMDGSSGGYSSRAGNAFMCVADESPENYLSYTGSVIAQGESLSADALIEYGAENYGIDIEECVSNNTYRALVSYATNLASQVGVSGTPTVLIDGEDWQNSDLEFSQQVENAIATGDVEGDAGTDDDTEAEETDIDDDMLREQSEPGDGTEDQ